MPTHDSDLSKGESTNAYTIDKKLMIKTASLDNRRVTDKLVRGRKKAKRKYMGIKVVL